MAERTQIPPSPVRAGAAPSAPTAPHATEAARRGPSTGPARFWSTSRVRWVFAASFGVSSLFHYAAGPWRLLPDRTLQIRDVAGELSISVDLLEGEPEPAPPSPSAGESKPVATDPNGMAVDAGVARHRDAGAAMDGGAPPDAPTDAERDSDAPLLTDASLALEGETGAGTGSPRDAVGMIGPAGNAQAGPQLVVLMVNAAVVRAHPVGVQMGALLSAIPQWDEYFAGSGVDPVRDLDWILINGPALVHTERDVMLVHYSAPDALVDKGMSIVAHKYDRGGAFDAGVPGVKAVLAHADHFERVLLRPQPHLLAVVPRDYATTAARILSRAAAKPPNPGEAVRLKLVHPHGPLPDIPETIAELRLWVVPHGDGSAEVFGDGDAADDATAREAAAKLRRVARDVNSLGVQFVTHGMLNGLEFSADGSTVHLHLLASRDQLEVLLALAAGQLGVNLPPSPGAPPP